MLNRATGVRFSLRVCGIGDNFQLHTLLADALIGRGLVEGEAPSAEAVACCRDRAGMVPTTGSFDSTAYRRNWPAGRFFPGMTGDLVYDHALAPEESAALLARVAAPVRRRGGAVGASGRRLPEHPRAGGEDVLIITIVVAAFGNTPRARECSGQYTEWSDALCALRASGGWGYLLRDVTACGEEPGQRNVSESWGGPGAMKEGNPLCCSGAGGYGPGGSGAVNAERSPIEPDRGGIQAGGNRGLCPLLRHRRR